MTLQAQHRETVVLLVEDDRDDFHLTQDLLKGNHREFYSIVWASSFEAAKTELDERTFDVALVDYRIGDRTGVEFIEKVGSRFPHCPMILLTGMEDPNIELAAEQAGAVDFLSKDSLTTERLDRAIRYARRNKQRFSDLDRLVASMAVGVVRVDATGKPTVWNRKATDALGVALPRQGDISVDMVTEGLRRLRVNGTFPSEFADSANRSFQLTISNGSDGGSILVMTDITSRIRTEQGLRQAVMEAKADSAAKSSFLRQLNHELRAPLNGIIGLARALDASELNSAQREQLSVIRSSSSALLKSASIVADLASVEACTLELDDVEFAIGSVVTEPCRALASAAEAKGLELTVFIDPLLPERMRGDPSRMKQIVTYVLGNAIKFTASGSVQVSIVSGIENGIPHVQLSVSDTGSGIDAAAVDHLSKPYYRVDNLAHRHDDVGLGLALCKELARAMGALFWYEPTERSGTSFHLRIAMPAEHAAIPKSRAAAVTATAGTVVMAVTSEQAVAATLEAYAKAMGHRFVWAASEREAASVLRTEQPAILVFDARASEIDPRALQQAACNPGKPGAPAFVMLAGSVSKPTKPAPAGLMVDATLQRPLGLDVIDVMNQVAEKVRASLAGATPNAPVDDSSGPLRILMAEDNAPNRMVASALLRSAGFELDIAEDGIVCLEKALARKYDVILMDVHMPRLDGLETTRQLRTNDHLRNIPIIALSAGAMQKDREACIQAGMSDYLAKPVDWDRLLTLLSQIEKAARRTASNAA